MYNDLFNAKFVLNVQVVKFYLVSVSLFVLAGGGEGHFMVYSVGDGIILWHDPKALDREGGSVTALITEAVGTNDNPIRTELSWNYDFSLVAVGNSDGYVITHEQSDSKIAILFYPFLKISSIVCAT
jgi:hypothetical protein